MDLKTIGMLFLCICAITVPVAGAAVSVTRTVSDDAVPPGADCTVTLVVSGLEVGGIVETLPPGSVVTGTSLSADRVQTADGYLAIAVMGEETISYTLGVPEGARGEITGVWEDFLGDRTGVITEGTGGETGTAPPAMQTSAPLQDAGNPEAPGFLSVMALAGFAIAALGRASGGGRR